MYPVRILTMVVVFLLFLAGIALLIPAIAPGEHVWALSMFAIGLVVLIGLIVSSLAATARERRRGPTEGRAARRRAQAARR